MDRTLITQEIRLITNKWDFIKLKRFCLAKETRSSEKTSYRMREKSPAVCLTEDGPVEYTKNSGH